MTTESHSVTWSSCSYSLTINNRKGLLKIAQCEPGLSDVVKSIFTKLIVCSDWPAIQCVVIGRMPQACDGNVTPLTVFGNTLKLRLLSLRKHLGGVTQIFPHSDVDMWCVFEWVDEWTSLNFYKESLWVWDFSLCNFTDLIYAQTACNTPKTKENLKSQYYPFKLYLPQTLFYW